MSAATPTPESGQGAARPGRPGRAVVSSMSRRDAAARGVPPAHATYAADDEVRPNDAGRADDARRTPDGRQADHARRANDEKRPDARRADDVDNARRAAGGRQADDAGRAEERRLRAALTTVVEPGEIPIARTIADAGVAAAWAAIRAGAPKLDPTGVRRQRAERTDGGDVLESAQAAGLRFVIPGDPEWPAALGVLDASLAVPEAVAPPIGLWIRGSGDLASLTVRSVAIVGARAATAYGDRTASDLAAELTELGWTVVSGGAYGIDAAAHRGALAVGGSTVAVLACGADVPYPRSHAGLLDRIAASGIVVSDLAPGTRPTKSRFLQRNRLIAGMATGTVVVEAARRSGALNTATWTDQLGREVGAVPGPVTSSLSAGCHHLVRERGATLVTCADDVLDLIGSWGDDAAPARSDIDMAAGAPGWTRRAADRRLDGVTLLARAMYDHLPTPPSRIRAPALAETAGCSLDEVDAALAELAAHELVEGDDADTWAIMID